MLRITTAIALCFAFVCATGRLRVAQAAGQRPRLPDLSGAWRLDKIQELVPSTNRTLIRSFANELKVAQDARSFTVDHPDNIASHPRVASHVLRSGGTVAPTYVSRLDVFWFGYELIIASNTRDTKSDTVVTSSSEKWSPESDGSLVIYLAEERADLPVERAILVYKRK